MTDKFQPMRFVAPAEKHRIIRELDVKHILPMYRRWRMKQNMPSATIDQIRGHLELSLHHARINLHPDGGVTDQMRFESVMWLGERGFKVVPKEKSDGT